jgi:hypothetical protein
MPLLKVSASFTIFKHHSYVQFEVAMTVNINITVKHSTVKDVTMHHRTSNSWGLAF